MVVSWTPLTLSEARGFVIFYTIAYTPILSSRRRQVSQDTMYRNASADSASVTIVGLDGSVAYSVQVSAGTRAGQGVQSAQSQAGGICYIAVHIVFLYVLSSSSCSVCSEWNWWVFSCSNCWRCCGGCDTHHRCHCHRSSGNNSCLL